MNKLSLDQVNLSGKRVFIRVDFNVPFENGHITDDTRIVSSLPTIRHAMKAGAKVIVASHMGRPKGKPDPQFSLKPVVPLFSKLLGAPVAFAEDCVGETALAAVNTLAPGGVVLLENLRFHKEEEKNDEGFAKKLAELCDVYVNDAFGSAHRAHASTEGMTRFVKPAVSGFLMKKEIEYFNRSLADPQRPLAALLGGAKVSTKLSVLENLLDKCDIMLIGGGMAFTFLKKLGHEIGGNILEPDMLDAAGRIMEKAKAKGVTFLLPEDFVVAESLDAAQGRVTDVHHLDGKTIAPDIGPATIEMFKKELGRAKTIIWNGPMGVFEKKQFSAGTMAMVEALAASPALTVVGGGDSVLAINMAGAADRIDFMSTGGGAFLELMEGKTLPGLAALTDA